MRKLHIIFLMGLLALSTGSFASNQDSKVSYPLTFDNWYTVDMVAEALESLHKAFPELTKLDTVGKSEEGREIYCMTVNNPKTGNELDKPGIYMDGNIHGNEIQGGEVSLYLLNYLLTQYGKNQEITQLVDKKCFYVVPVVNPDGRHHFFQDANDPDSNRSLRIPKDDDRDGLVDEDFPDDLDEDGNICQMRKKDPFGQYKTDPEDPRLMIKIKPGEKGEWTILGSEGIDNDSDGQVNEDSEGYVDPNRNWGFAWMPEYVQDGAGDYPFSGKGIKALGEYIRQRTNICIVWSLHNFGGMFLRGPATKTQGEYPAQDIAVYNYLGEQAERITPGYRYLISWKSLYTTYGDFTEWMVMINGAYGFVPEITLTEDESFKTRKEEKEAKPPREGFTPFSEDPSLDRERLKFNDHLTQGERYRPWKSYQHPTYGDIEIGGWIKMSTRIPASFMIKDMVHRNASVIIFSAKHTPEIKLEVFDIKKIDKDFYRLRTRLSNSKAIPSMSYHAQKVKLYPQDMLRVEGKKAKVVAGGLLKNAYMDQVNYKKYRPELQFLAVPGFGKVEHQFLITGSGSVTLKYASRFAGKITKTVELQ